MVGGEGRRRAWPEAIEGLSRRAGAKPPLRLWRACRRLVRVTWSGRQSEHGPFAEPAIRKMASYRGQLRARGLRPVQVWVPDLREPRGARPAAGDAALVRGHASTPKATPSSTRPWPNCGLAGLRRGDMVPVALSGDMASRARHLVVQPDSLNADDCAASWSARSPPI